MQLGSREDQVEIMGSGIVNICIDKGVIRIRFDQDQRINGKKLQDDCAQAQAKSLTGHRLNGARRGLGEGSVDLVLQSGYRGKPLSLGWHRTCSFCLQPCEINHKQRQIYMHSKAIQRKI